MKNLCEIGFADSFITIKPMSKTQRECLKIFNTEEPVSKYVENIAVHNMIKYARKPHDDKAVN